MRQLAACLTASGPSTFLRPSDLQVARLHPAIVSVDILRPSSLLKGTIFYPSATRSALLRRDGAHGPPCPAMPGWLY